MPKVSVIVPNYNHEKYLTKRIVSILGQTFRDYELIFLDDASSDNSLDVFRSLVGDKQSREILSDINSGSPFIQWNKGASIANGEYLWFAESDDWSDNDFLSELVDIMDRNPSVGIAYAQSYFINSEDQVVGSNLEFTKDFHSSLWDEDFIMNGRQFCQEYEVFKNPIHNASSSLIRKCVWDRVGPVDECMKRCGDWLQVVKILKHSDIAYLSRHLNYYRNDDSAWEPQYPQIFDIKNEEYQILTYIKENFEVPDEVLNKRLDQLCSEWVGRVVYNSNWSEYEKIKNVLCYYRKFCSYDDKLKPRVLRSLSSKYIKKVSTLVHNLF